MNNNIYFNGNSNTTWLLDPGHGGWKDGMYQTPGAKQYTFENHDNHTFYEGVFNRRVVSILKDLMEEKGISYYDVTECSEDDIPLSERVSLANTLNAKYGGDTVFVSVHGNAFGNKIKGDGESPSGFSVYTSPGLTPSDEYAKCLFYETKYLFPDQKHRKYSHKQVDWEARFYVLVHTAMPAILSENLFYTNWNDVQVMDSEEGQYKIALAHLNMMIKMD